MHKDYLGALPKKKGMLVFHVHETISKNYKELQYY